MWGRAALVLAAVVSGFGITAPAVAAAPPPSRGVDPAAVNRHVDGQVPAADVATCRAVLTSVSQWNGGLQATVAVTNTGTVPILWKVTIDFPGARIIPPPGFVIIQTGPTSWLIYPPPPASWNGILPPGASTYFGFQASVTGPISMPLLTCTATPA